MSSVLPRSAPLPRPYGGAPEPAAAPLPTPVPPAPPAGEELFEQPGGSAYVTAHLAALARTTPAELRAQTATAPPRAAAHGSPVTFAIPAPPGPSAARTPPPPPPVPPEPRERPPLELRELIPEQRGRPPAPIAPAPADWPARAALERRTVQPGSHTRARAGVEKGLARYGIGEALAGELIDTAMAHVLPLAPRAGLAAAVRTTLAQRIPVAPAAGRRRRLDRAGRRRRRRQDDLLRGAAVRLPRGEHAVRLVRDAGPRGGRRRTARVAAADEPAAAEAGAGRDGTRRTGAAARPLRRPRGARHAARLAGRQARDPRTGAAAGPARPRPRAARAAGHARARGGRAAAWARWGR